MELSLLLERMKMEHLSAQLDGVCEQAAKGDLDYKGFLAQALEAEWRGRYQRSVEGRLKLARFPWVKTLDQFDFEFQTRRADFRHRAFLPTSRQGLCDLSDWERFQTRPRCCTRYSAKSPSTS
jgi:DNA replication protein DnaC